VLSVLCSLLLCSPCHCIGKSRLSTSLSYSLVQFKYKPSPHKVIACLVQSLPTFTAHPASHYHSICSARS
jgi:hypothetical protein